MSEKDIQMEILLDHYRSPRNYGKIENPSGEIVEYNPVCGDAVQFSFSVSDGKIKDIRFIGRGCSVSQGSASMLTEMVKGMALDDAMKIEPETILSRIDLDLGPSREKCALLSLNALHKMIRKYGDK
ncbi:MAG: iron-sulfur cluster assembly scaffold protein [Candidatus Thermoplasmatota archaeon]|nr:iron-sulfur cluster assembly scaffold protein [Candidatus Thermoplasmatota archaeon]